MVGNHIFLSFVCSPEKKMGGGGEWWGVHMKDGESSKQRGVFQLLSDTCLQPSKG